MKMWRRRGVLVVAGAAALILLSACTGNANSTTSADGGSNSVLTIGREGNTVFTRNFNPFSPNAVPGTTTAIYEPLVVYTPTNQKYTPWLAKSWKFGPDAKSLTFQLRTGVKWSDGKPFTATDVVDTFQIIKKYFAGGGFPYLTSVTASGASSVTFNFNESFSPALGQVGQQVIVPGHIWTKVADPTKYTNPNPVGTGPFTQVTNFQPQGYEIDKNLHYWQPGKPYFKGIRYPAYAGNDQVQEALTQGDLDWADIYVPNVQKTFVAKDPSKYSYWFAPTGYTVMLEFNTTKKPLSDPTLRKAISMALNRQADDTSVYGPYVDQANPTGLDPKSASAFYDATSYAGDDWTKFDPTTANAMLDKAGYKKGSNGIRVAPDGTPLKFTIETGGTSTDFVAWAQAAARQAQEIGVDLTVSPKDWNTVASDVELGKFDLGLMYGVLGSTPYDFYYDHLSCAAVKPVGTEATENWERYCDRGATDLLSEFGGKSTQAQQKTIADQLQKDFVADVPSVPLFTAPDWGEFNTTHFTGFPSASNPYATGQSRYPGAVIVLTTVKPVK